MRANRNTLQAITCYRASLAQLMLVVMGLWMVAQFPVVARSATNHHHKKVAIQQINNLPGPEQNKPVAQQVELWRKHAPTLPLPGAYKLPPITSYKLSNG